MGFYIDEETPKAQGSAIPQGFFIDEEPTTADVLKTGSAADAAGQAITDLPQAIVNIPVGLGQLGSDVASTIAHPIEEIRPGGAFERAATTGAGLSSALAGGLVGASFGSVVPIVGTAIGGALGAGAGLLGMDWLLNGGPSENPQEDLNKLVYNTTQGAALSGAGKLVGATGKGVQQLRGVTASGLDTVGKALGEITPRGKATSLLRNAAEKEILSMKEPTAGTDPFYASRTLAEELQSPKLANLQDLVGKRFEGAKDAIVKNESLRRKIQQDLFKTLSEEDAKTSEAAGLEIRGILEDQAQSAFEKAGIPFTKINQQGLVPFSTLRDTISEAVKGEYKAGGIPSQLSDIVREVNKTTKIDNAIVSRKYQPFDYIHDLRERAQQVWVDAKNAQDLKQARVANTVVKAIDSAIESAPEAPIKGKLSQTDVKAFKKGNLSYSEASDIFRSGKVGGALAKMKENSYFSKASELVENVFDGTPEGTKQLLKALPKDAEALDVARGAVRDYIWESTKTNDEIFGPGRFRTFIRKHKEGLTAEIDGKRLFEPDHLATIEKIADDLGYLDPQSQQSVSSLARRASKGQSTTAETLLVNRLAGMADSVARFPFVKGAVKWYSDSVDQILTQAMIRDKAFAKELLKPATPSRVARLAEMLKPPTTPGFASRALSQLPPAYSYIGLQSASLARDSAKQSRGEGKVLSNPYPNAAPTSAAKQQKSSPSSYIDAAMDRAEQKAQGLQADTPEAPKIKNVRRVSMDYVEPIIAAVVEQESAGNAKAVSSAGALGLMQVMPATAKDIAKELGIRKYDLTDPETNVAFGTYYLKKLLREFDGDLELALTAYHSGPERVKNLLKIHDASTFAEIRPYLGPVGRKYAPQVLTRLKKIGLVEA